MCGRTVLSLSNDQIQCACSYKPKGNKSYLKPDWLNEHNAGKDYASSYNIAPTDVTPVLVSSSKFRHATNYDRALKPMMWGIIPPWHKGDYKTHNLSTNNCRIENIKSSKLYNPILRNGGRCVIVVEGFYEWQTTVKSSKVKTPYYIYSPQESYVKDSDSQTCNNDFNEKNGWSGVNLLHIAGLYNVWQHDGTVIYSYSVITMESNSTLDWLHHRMPAILDTQEQVQAWLDVDGVDPDMALTYLNPVKKISFHQVSTLVNNSRNKSADCFKRLNTDKQSKTSQTTLNSWFIKVEKRKSSDEHTSASESKKKKIERTE